MKIVVEKAKLVPVLGRLASVAKRNSTIPILSNVLIDAAKGGVSLCATDMDIELIEQVPAQVSDPGRFTVGVHTFHDIVRKLKDGAHIEIETDGGPTNKKNSYEVAVRSGRSSFKVATLPHEDFPKAKSGDLPHSFSVSAGELRRLLDQAKFAISTEETRYYLNGIYLHVAQNDDHVGVLRGCATDGHRLARVDISLPEGAREMKGVIVPRKTVAEARKLIDGLKDGDEVAIGSSETRIAFEIDGAKMTSKVIDGTFPDYDRVIPKNNANVVTAAKAELTEAVDRVSTISTERSNAIKFDLAAGRIELSARDPNNGVAVDEVEARYTGTPFHVGFNARYMLDVAAQIGGEVIEFRLHDPSSPAIVVDPANAGSLFVLMPMRVG